ncbi:O-antigen ligase family protein [Bacteroides oleiciplenus]|uniref:O-antigen ligase family protein n=1 Tax=Bacteroides oleiciplenus TaxID=626931 RepID=UPI0026DAE766|nr:O-antigen ligase family protein [Bacteroides oleiciplenus]
MKKLQIHTVRGAVAACLLFVAVCAPVGVVSITTPMLPADENIGQWVWFGKALLLSGVCILVTVLLQLFGKDTRKYALRFPCFSVCVSWGLILCGAFEAIGGLRQLYGFAASGHSRYALTGSFFNPGPYAGYLAMVLPLCLHLYLCIPKEKAIIHNLEKWAVVIISILILCVLPATMSRSAWIAAVMGCGWVAYMHRDKRRWHVLWRRYKRRYILWGTGILFIVVLGITGAFILKPDSALGRLFMWKITCKAIINHPWGCEKGFAFAYGEAQETYFAQEDYAGWEERVAGSPEYAFNEYLSLALTEGIAVCVLILVLIEICLRMGVKRGRYGICGAILSLLVFSFSSYPMHFPAFVVAGVCLLLACGIGDVIGKPLILCICLILWTGGCMEKWRQEEDACRKWVYARMLYYSGAYKAANEAYGELYPILKDRGAFLFEYGHSLHKSFLYSDSNKYLEEACLYSTDPMVLNVIGKNYQELHCYEQAETFFYKAIHRLPGRIYPYYLLANLYAEPDFYNPDKLKEVAGIVLTKEPKVHSTAIKEMRSKVREILEKANME